MSSTDAASPQELVRKRIEETNAEFIAAPRERRRVMLAEDILHQLSLGRIEAMSTYLRFDGMRKIYNPETDEDYDHEIKDILSEVPKCQVCGIGAFFVCAVERLDEIRVHEWVLGVNSRGAIMRYLGRLDLFTASELDAIEDYFEHGRNPVQHTLRLENIAETIIKTKGAYLFDITGSTPF